MQAGWSRRPGGSAPLSSRFWTTCDDTRNANQASPKPNNRRTGISTRCDRGCFLVSRAIASSCNPAGARERSSFVMACTDQTGEGSEDQVV